MKKPPTIIQPSGVCRFCGRMRQCDIINPNISIYECGVAFAPARRKLIRLRLIERDVVDHEHDHLFYPYMESGDE
ncbi:hypothetical protein LG047_12250 [Methylocystis sp. WRRC1]|uniref:hypothetical protein n=1 Tax=Methylocystis sp. WRRC1 TaxID=1732014 RepID=UPI001D14C70D|nr:hypothetical protein [Methylocystis sp. WRRC1]MCC3246084.1 hypothetical protein [Methylocystis sp. WRRC1]